MLLRLFNYFNSVSGPSFLFVDEFDAFRHHDLAESVVDCFKETEGLQVPCASHNTDLFSNKVLLRSRPLRNGRAAAERRARQQPGSGPPRRRR